MANHLHEPEPGELHIRPGSVYRVRSWNQYRPGVSGPERITLTTKDDPDRDLTTLMLVVGHLPRGSGNAVKAAIQGLANLGFRWRPSAPPNWIAEFSDYAELATEPPSAPKVLNPDHPWAIQLPNGDAADEKGNLTLRFVKYDAGGFIEDVIEREFPVPQLDNKGPHPLSSPNGSNPERIIQPCHVES